MSLVHFPYIPKIGSKNFNVYYLSLRNYLSHLQHNYLCYSGKNNYLQETKMNYFEVSHIEFQSAIIILGGSKHYIWTVFFTWTQNHYHVCVCVCVYLLCVCVCVLSLSGVWLFATPWIATHQASVPFTISQSLLKFMSIESVMLSNHPILCHLLR